MKGKTALVLLAGLLFILSAKAQQEQPDSLLPGAVPSAYIDAVEKKADQIEKKLDAKTGKALQRFQKQERRLQHKLSGIDSVAAKRVFSGAQQQYASLEKKLSESKFNQYIPSLDSITVSL